jgi:hypothetical protein
MPPAASVPLAQPAVPAPPPAVDHDARLASDTTRGLTPGAWVAGLLVLFGAGAAAYFAMRSRRRREDEVYDETYETAPAQAPEPAHVEPEPVVVQPMAANEPTGGLVPEAPLPAFAMVDETIGEPEAKAIEPTPHPTDAQRIGSEELAPATPATGGQPFVMPAGLVPQTRAERDALLEEMVAAPPDEANPFTSRKGRMRRARMILAAREYDQKHDATQPFDWRTYEPSTSHPAPATPPRVTA